MSDCLQLCWVFVCVVLIVVIMVYSWMGFVARFGVLFVLFYLLRFSCFR